MSNDTDSTRERGAQAQDHDDARTPQEIRADIDQTREDLGDTVEALAAKTDVAGQAKAKVTNVKSNAQAKVSEVTSTAKARVEAVKGKLGHAGSEGGAYGPATTPGASDRAAQTAQKAATVVKENPTGFAIGTALVVGYMVGKARGRRS